MCDAVNIMYCVPSVEGFEICDRSGNNRPHPFCHVAERLGDSSSGICEQIGCAAGLLIFMLFPAAERLTLTDH